MLTLSSLPSIPHDFHVCHFFSMSRCRPRPRDHMVALASCWRVRPCAQLPESVTQSREKVTYLEHRCAPPTRADAEKPDHHLDLWLARFRSICCTQAVLHPPCACFGRLASIPFASARSICHRPTCIRRALEREDQGSQVSCMYVVKRCCGELWRSP